MTSTTMRAKIVRVGVEKGDAGLHFATSRDLKGLYVAEPTLDELDDAVPRAIEDLYRASGVDVVVLRADDDDGGQRRWIVIPVLALSAVRHRGAA